MNSDQVGFAVSKLIGMRLEGPLLYDRELAFDTESQSNARSPTTRYPTESIGARLRSRRFRVLERHCWCTSAAADPARLVDFGEATYPW